MHPAVGSMRRWVETVVLGLSLCPWARPVHECDAIRYVYCDATLPGMDGESVLAESALREMTTLLQGDPPATTIIVAPDVHPTDFVAFNECVVSLEERLVAESLHESFQVVGFHPRFRFAGEADAAPGNFVNRSPSPALHILRQDDVTAAVAAHAERGEVDIPLANQQRLESLGGERLRELLTSVQHEETK